VHRVTKRVLRSFVAGVLGLSGSALQAVPAWGCDAIVKLAGFPGEAQNNPLYFTPEPHEGDSQASFAVESTYSCLGPTTAHYDVSGGNAGVSDYTATSGSIPFPAEGGTEARSVTIHSDDVIETVEKTEVALTAVENAWRGTPFRAPMYIVDTDGAPRTSFGESSLRTYESNPKVAVPVFRSGSADSAAAVPLSISSAPEPGATEGEDYTLSAPASLEFAAGERAKVLVLTVINDTTPELDENVTLTLSGAGIGSPSSVMVTISRNDGFGDVTPPYSQFHHPKHGWTYFPGRFGQRSYRRIAEVHVFTGDEGTPISGVARVKIALRKKLKSGACAWWNGDEFGRRACWNEDWVSEGIGSYEENFFYFRLQRQMGGKRLTPSIGTRVRNYTIYSRAIDHNGNVETRRQQGRDANTFEVAQPE
jgi:Calx-beta domain